MFVIKMLSFYNWRIDIWFDVPTRLPGFDSMIFQEQNCVTHQSLIAK